MSEITGIPIHLEPDTPSKVTAEELKKELNDIGLYCKDTRVEKLRQYIAETLDQFPDGTLQGFGVYRYQPPALEEFFQKGFTSKPVSELFQSIDDIHSNWKPTSIEKHMVKLSAIAVPEHFDYLKEHYLGFAGSKSQEHYEQKDSTVDAIKTLFVKTALNISSALIENLDKNQMEAAFTKIISPVDPGNIDYDSDVQNRNVYLVKDYSNDVCQGFGVLNVEYHLVINNYKEKKSLHTRYTLDVTVRASLYADDSELDAEMEYLKTIFKNTMFFGRNSAVSPEVKIYDVLPLADEDTFIHSLPLEQTQNDIISCMVLYGPELENIGCIDNTDSDGQAQYSKTTTSGFTFTFGQKIAAGFKYEAGIVFTKAEFNIGFEISFTEQWNKSQSETVTFTVPKQTKAYLYQGYLQCARLEYNVKTFKYSYHETGRFLSNIIKTTPKPIDAHPARMVKNTADVSVLSTERPLWEQL